MSRSARRRAAVQAPRQPVTQPTVETTEADQVEEIADVNQEASGDEIETDLADETSGENSSGTDEDVGDDEDGTSDTDPGETDDADADDDEWNDGEDVITDSDDGDTEEQADDQVDAICVHTLKVGGKYYEHGKPVTLDRKLADALKAKGAVKF